MLFLLSPAKKLEYDTPLHTQLHSDPLFVQQSKQLIAELKPKSASEVAKLMALSPALAQLNVDRYAQWMPKSTQKNARPAILAFNGDVYEGLDAATLNDKDLNWAQEHIVILSGLYGALRPLDLMQPYRLEMGTKLSNPAGKNLYDFWKLLIAPYLNERLAADNKKPVTNKMPVIINLASEEYFKSVDINALNARVVQCVFKEGREGVFKIISFYAKRARGLMTRFAIESRAKTPNDLIAFNLEGYVYQADLSTPDKLVFHRST
jgi:cytoplasmic iron level regulating protein YaaA (DUF328/UPF0246 family)